MPDRIKTGSIGNHPQVSTANRSEKLIIYQLFPRIFTNACNKRVRWGTLEQNGSGKLNDITPKVLHCLKKMGINTVWLTGVIEHATKTDFTKYGIEKDNPHIIKGEAGSVYAIKDYYDIDPALAENVLQRKEEFVETVKRIHNEGLKVLIDFVPNHTARQYHSDVAPKGVEDFGANDDITKFFDSNNNYYYIPNQKFSPTFNTKHQGDEYFEFPAKATGNDCFSAFCSEYDWYETVKLNYGQDYGDGSEHFYPIPDTWNKMLDILRFWAATGIDGFRCDMVFMVPLPFWHWVIPQIKKDFPDIIFIGEIYDISQYRPFLDYGCFDYLYDKVNLYDTLVGIERYGVSAARLSDCWKTVDGIGDRLLNFLENHDEVRFASEEFAGNPAKIIPYLVTASMISKGPFMIYYGQELGEPATDNEGYAGDNHRTTIFDYWQIDTIARWYNAGKCDGKYLTKQEKWLRNVYSKILNLCNKHTAISNGSFFDLMYVNLQNPDFDPHSLFSWLRYNESEILLIIVNFSNESHKLKLYIPDLAFDMANIKAGEYVEKDLIWDREIKFDLSRTNGIKLHISAKDALILPLKKENT